MDISVIMSVYYKEQPLYLQKALNSLFYQTKKAKEVIQKTQHEQLKITLKRMEEEKKHAKLLKKSSKKA